MSNLLHTLAPRYAPRRAVSSIVKDAKSFLDPLIIPKLQAFSAKGIRVQTNIKSYGGEILDFSGQTVTCLLGQNDPWVTANMASYIMSGRPSFLSTTMGHELYYSVPLRMKKLSKMGTDSFVNHRLNNGSDATDFAINLACFYHKKDKKRTIFLAFKGSYHGQGHLLYGISDLEPHLRFFSSHKVIFLDAPSHTQVIGNGDSLSAHDMIILKKISSLGKKIIGLIIEPIQVNNNGNTPSRAFLKGLRAVCTKQNIPLIYDEIQTGWGWLGTMTASERYGVWPDIMALSKAITSGYGPLAVVIAKNKFKHLEAFGARTNGSDIRSLVAAQAVMDRLVGTRDVPRAIKRTPLGRELTRGLLVDFKKKEQLLLQHLVDLKKTINNMSSTFQIGDIKGAGLIRFIEIKTMKGSFNSTLTQKLQDHLLFKAGVFVRLPSNHADMHTLIIKLPIITTPKELTEGFARMHKAMSTFTL